MIRIGIDFPMTACLNTKNDASVDVAYINTGKTSSSEIRKKNAAITPAPNGIVSIVREAD